VDDGRRLLKELNKTNLNKNISLIMKLLTGKGPPQISEDLYQLGYSIFLQVMEARENINFKNRNNRIYYPYYLYKIFDIILESPDDRRLLNYIHLHKNPTLANNDLEWYDICNNVPFLNGKYIPTISGIRYIK
jgi:hypothetical protein